jgi:hypothetical protein
MIITQQDIDDLTEFYEHHQRDFEQRVNVSREPETYTTTTDYILKLLGNVSLEPESYPTDYFADHPHLLFPLGYDDYRAIPFQDDASAKEKIAHLGLLDEFVTDRLCMPYEPFFRKTASGEWFWFEGITHYKINTAGRI